MPASNYQQQKLRVCEVCSAFLGIHDNDRRLADHFGGKLHVGFITLRSKLAELQVCVLHHPFVQVWAYQVVSCADLFPTIAYYMQLEKLLNEP